MDGWSDRDQYGDFNIKRQQVYGVYKDDLLGNNEHKLVGYFRTREDAQRCVPIGYSRLPGASDEIAFTVYCPEVAG